MDLRQIITEAALKYGQDPDELIRIAELESSMNPKANNPKSSAGGLFQFIDKTAKAYGLEDRYDPVQAADAAARLLRDNRAYLKTKLDREPRPGEGYLAHQQGPGGAVSLLLGPQRKAESLVGPDAVALNGGNSGMTAQEFANKWIEKGAIPTQLGEGDLSYSDSVTGGRQTIQGVDDMLRKQARGESLNGFAGEMKSEAFGVTSILEQLNAGSNDIQNYQKSLIDAKERAGPSTIGGSLPQTAMPGGPALPPERASPNMREARLPNGQPVIGGPVVSTNNMPAPSSAGLSSGTPVVSSSGGGGGGGGGGAAAQPAQSAGGGFMSKLFGEPGSDQRVRVGDTLAALSQGLGQMSAGQAVDLSSVFNRIQTRRLAAANDARAREESIAAAAREEGDAALQERRIELEEKRFGLAQRKADVEEMQYFNEIDGYTYSPAELANIAADQQLSGFVPDLKSSDPARRQLAAEAISEIQLGRAKAAIAEAGEDNTPLGRAVAEWNTATPERKGQLAADMSLDQMQRFSSMPGIDKPTSIEEFETMLDYAKDDPAKANMLMNMLTAKSGQATAGMMQTQANFTNGMEYNKQLASNVQTANTMDVVADDIIRATDELAGSELPASKQRAWASEAANYVNGLGAAEAEQFEGFVGMDIGAFKQLDAATQRLALMAAKPLMEGGGSITDSERAQVAKAVTQSDLSDEDRLKYMFRLKALNAIDRQAYNHYGKTSGEAYQNHDAAERANLLVLEPASSAIAAAWQADGALVRARRDPEKYGQFVGHYDGLTMLDVLPEYAVPIDSLSDFATIRDVLPENFDRAVFNRADGIYYYENKAGELVPVDEDKLAQRSALGGPIRGE